MLTASPAVSAASGSKGWGSKDTWSFSKLTLGYSP